MKERLHRTAQMTGLRARKLARLGRRPAYWPALRAGVAASVEHGDVDFRDDVRTVLDVGASRGQFAVFAANRWPEARLICFEPLPDARSRLERVVPAGRADVHPVALGTEPGEVEMHVSARDDSSSLLPIGPGQTTAFPGTEEAGTQRVRVDVLENHVSADLARPVLLKIDVQGFELDVLEGAGGALAHIDELYVECSFLELYTGQALADEVVAFLRGRGFRLAGVYGVVRRADGTSVQADFLFRRVDATPRT
jgi:FkbM family methyltransferase